MADEEHVTAPTSKPQTRNVIDELREHIPSLKDAYTGDKFDVATTELVHLHEKPKKLLTDCTSVVRPAIPCQIELDEELLLPAFDPAAHHPLRFTYCKLLQAPRLRLEYDIHISSARKDTLVLEFPFNSDGVSNKGIQDHSHDSAGWVTFTAFSATCAGFNKLDPHFPIDGNDGNDNQRLLHTLRSLLAPERPVEMKLKLHYNLLSERDQENFKRIQDVLPGGGAPLLPSISGPRHTVYDYEAYGAGSDCTTFDQKREVKPKRDRRDGQCPHYLPTQGTLLRERNRPLMIALESSDTFNSVKEGCIELQYSALINETESRLTLQKWADTTHSAQLYLCHDGNTKYAAIAVKAWLPFQTLDNAGMGFFKLPKELEVEMEFALSSEAASKNVRGKLIESHPRLGGYVAIFRITSASWSVFGDAAQKAGDHKAPQFQVSFRPHYNVFSFCNQMTTVRRLQEATPWHALFLNQRHDDIPFIDTTAKSLLPEAEKSRLFTLLQTCKSWSSEELQVIDSLKRLKGGMGIVMSPGCGSSLNRALSLYFWALGYHVLNTAPANNNCNNMVSSLTPNALRAEFPMWDLSNFSFMRLYPSARDIGGADLTEEQAERTKDGHRDGAVLDLKDFANALEDRPKAMGTTREHGGSQALITAAKTRSLALEVKLSGDKEDTNAWDTLRELIKRVEDGEIKVQDLMSRASTLEIYGLETEEDRDWVRYTQAYGRCKRQLIGLNRYMISTTSNVNASELTQYWYKTGHAPCVGVIMLVDNAHAELELNLWAGIVGKRWSAAGVFLFGDDKLLGPVNTSSAKLNPYHARLNIDLPSRLVREGFPHHRVKEQSFMHPTLAEFVGPNIYDNHMRSHPSMRCMLDTNKPGLRDVLWGIICRNVTPGPSKDWIDDKVRRHWLQVHSHIVKQGSTSSAAPKHIDLFFDTVFPPIQAYFKARGEKVCDNLMIIVAYAHAKRLYSDKIRKLKAERHGLTMDDFPRLETVDGSQGKSSFMVVLDGSFQNGDKLGFMKDPRRVNVAFTRATDVFWVIGGDMQCKPQNKKLLINQYREWLKDKGLVRKFGRR